MSHAVDFFDSQFRAQVANGDFALNPFEQAALPYLSGDVLDLGCGLGNLALAAARGGCRVTALDGSAAAIAHIAAIARAEGLPLVARQADLAAENPTGDFDAVVAIGLAMFFPRPRSTELLAAIQRATRPGGIAVVNALVEGTTFLDLFGDGGYTLFGRDELERSFAGWEVLRLERQGFDAPRGTRKEFATVIARKPA
jgi:tellurite methyltransferase